MKNLNVRLREESLNVIIADFIEKLKLNPTDCDLRCSFIELLCIDGQFERADQQVSLLIKQRPEYLVGGNNLRQLIHAAQSRIDYFNGHASAQLLVGETETFEHFVALNMARLSNDIEDIEQRTTQLEATRKVARLKVNGKVHEDCRELDDSLAGYLELFGTDGGYYLVPFDAIDRLEFKPVTSLIELVWRKVDIEVAGGPSGDAFVPITYIASETDAQKLGRETDWLEISGTQTVVGQGLKMWLVGEEAIALSQCEVVEAEEKRQVVTEA
ncbi:hypothetical protein A3K86_19010 [Photobacterium jeanii]|uniref:Protein of avirulence locus ImpE n=1 Tax=Photobacterium jeanii TaxID=858640 RepID=A0A178K2V4_9GAMM|nr:type VI secretion system accessory protein TagJ [Photobacterium jeanii]OAN11064.1 hypothetical protein A3K86_19010 [Photobacterium jeanii]PST90578.1 protein of avirulence locus ImpE [Photobacterium jeanii]